MSSSGERESPRHNETVFDMLSYAYSRKCLLLNVRRLFFIWAFGLCWESIGLESQ